MTTDPWLRIAVDDLRGPEIAALLEAHLANSRLHSPPGSCHALDLPRLRGPDITFWSAWSEGRLLGCGALRELDGTHGEVKSMHTAAPHRGRGVGEAILRTLLGEARRRGYGRVSLETGSMDAYAPARRLYERFGFQVCPPFGDYRVDPYSTCMTLALERTGTVLSS